MTRLSFLKPVSYGECPDSEVSFKKKLTQFVDSYFYLGGKRAHVIPGSSTSKLQMVRMVEEKPKAVLSALKIASYFTIVAPLFALCSKAILRSMSSYEVEEIKSKKPQVDIHPDLPNTDPRLIGALYQTHYVVNKVLHQFGIAYWADGGSALGLERHGSIIPWDDDEDWCIFPGHEEKILNQEFLAEGNNRELYDQRNLVLREVKDKEKEKQAILDGGTEQSFNLDPDRLINPAIQAEFKKYGLKIVADNWQGFKIFPLKCPSFGSVHHCGPTAGWTTTPHIDLFVTQKKKDDDGRTKYILTKRALEIWPKDYFYEEELFGKELTDQDDPLQLLRHEKFGPVELSTAQNNKPYLKRQYGEDCMVRAYRQFDHKTGQNVVMEKVKITKFTQPEYEYPYDTIKMPKES